MAPSKRHATCRGARRAVALKEDLRGRQLAREDRMRRPPARVAYPGMPGPVYWQVLPSSCSPPICREKKMRPKGYETLAAQGRLQVDVTHLERQTGTGAADVEREAAGRQVQGRGAGKCGGLGGRRRWWSSPARHGGRGRARSRAAAYCGTGEKPAATATEEKGVTRVCLQRKCRNQSPIGHGRRAIHIGQG
ncbi:hypothetical protein K523DRAFT_100955 [Schizophyllum commune Tattone D]|nr:hypothetical protein K523DRAFT_100955 [Schizophyllum commune Tattone D]